MYFPFFFLFLIKVKIKEMYRKVVEKTEHGLRKESVELSLDLWPGKNHERIVERTVRGCVPRAKYQEGGKKSEKKNEKCKQDQRASPCSTSRCRDGPGSIPTTFLSPLDIIFALQNLHKR